MPTGPRSRGRATRQICRADNSVYGIENVEPKSEDEPLDRATAGPEACADSGYGRARMDYRNPDMFLKRSDIGL